MQGRCGGRGGGEGSRATSAPGDHLAKRVSKAAFKPVERGGPWVVPSLKFIKSNNYSNNK